MKMHSYNSTNMLLKENSSESRKRGWRPVSNYPQNVDIDDFTYFLVAPTLVYWVEYPKTEKIRWRFFLDKVGLAVLGLMSMYLIVSDVVMPIMSVVKNVSEVQAVVMLVWPVAMVVCIGFFTIWDCMLNAIAEVTRFADREFYEDWWNASSYDDFVRRWNKVLYEFLYRHVYCEALWRYELPRAVAYLMTLMLSGQLHEFVVDMVAREPGFFVIVVAIVEMVVLKGMMGVLGEGVVKYGNVVVLGVKAVGMAWVVVRYLPGRF